MNWLDWLILLTVISFAWRGYKTGLVVQLFDLAGSVIALFFGFAFFEIVGRLLQNWLKVSLSLTNLLGFLSICLGISGTVSLLGRLWHNKQRNKIITAIDNWGGVFFAVLKSLIIIAICLLFITAFPGAWQQPVFQSGLAQDILNLTPFFYAQFEKTLPSNMPRLILTPEGVNLNKVDLNKILHGTCVACHKPVRLEKYERRGLSFIPVLRCEDCGLYSDGCLTFEGYHIFYKECPLAAQEKGDKVHCRFWPDEGFVIVEGPCPVCGRR